MKEGTKHHENTQCIVLQIVWQNANSNVKCEHHEYHSTNEGGMAKSKLCIFMVENPLEFCGLK